MELKEYIAIIKKNTALYMWGAIIVILAVFAFFYLRPVSYDASLTLSITRMGAQNTESFRYDDFYRIQADEKFAETVVEWLKSPRIASDILSRADLDSSGMNLRSLSKAVSAQKLSSQVVGINFSAPDARTAERMSAAIIKVLSENTQSLNKDQKEETWFEIMPQDPLIQRYQPSLFLVLLGSLAAGAFIGFWVVMAKHYVSN